MSAPRRNPTPQSSRKVGLRWVPHREGPVSGECNPVYERFRFPIAGDDAMKIGGRLTGGSRHWFLRWHFGVYPSPNPNARGKKAFVLQSLECPDNCPTRDTVAPSKVPRRREVSRGIEQALKNRGTQFLVQPIRQGLASMALVEREFKRTDNFAHKPQMVR